jgi:hypothetical protein
MILGDLDRKEFCMCLPSRFVRRGTFLIFENLAGGIELDRSPMSALGQKRTFALQ